MDKITEKPISEMDDNALQIHALGVAYREAERRREEAEKQTEQMKEEAADLEAQIKEMAEAYQAVMVKNTKLNTACRKQQEELENLRQQREELEDLRQQQQQELENLRQQLAEAQRTQEAAERGQDA